MEPEEPFGIRSAEEFDRCALSLFRMQAEHCAPYRQYLAGIEVDPAAVGSWQEIPHLPIALFKSHEVYCGRRPPQVVFSSSTTGGARPSRHPMEELAHYERTFFAAFRLFYGEPSGWSLYGLLPSYLERQGSSLVHMVDRLIAACGSGGFYLDDYERLTADMASDPKPKILLGVSYALWTLAERYPRPLHRTVVMETGGMKGRREELPREEFHRILCRAFHVERIHSEYGMAELTSQAYSDGEGIFQAPPWMRVTVRDEGDPFRRMATGRRGAINIADLANRSSCAFIETEDAGRLLPDGRFEVLGRLDGSEQRGCNLMVE